MLTRMPQILILEGHQLRIVIGVLFYLRTPLDIILTVNIDVINNLLCIYVFTELYFNQIHFCVVENYVEYLHKKKAKESSVHRNPYETHDAYDAIRTQDADLAVRKFILSLTNAKIVRRYLTITISQRLCKSKNIMFDKLYM